MDSAPAYSLLLRPNRPLWEDWRALWQYRELFWTLAMRSVLVRYKQTVMGILWAVVQPVLTMVVFTVVFGKLAKLGTDDPLYYLKVFAATLPWQLFAASLTQSTESVVAHSGMIQKIYFPRIIIPTSACVPGLIDFCLAAVVFALLMLIQGVFPTWRIVVLLPLTLLALVTALGAGFWLSALNARFRDVHHIVPFLVRLGIYVSPVGYMSDIVPEQWRLLYSLNPLVSVIDGFRWALFDSAGIHLQGFAISTAIVLIMFATGLVFYSRQQRTFADYI